MSISVDTKGVNTAIRKFEQMNDKVRRTINRTAASAATTPLNKAAKRNAKKVSKTVAKSIGKRGKTYLRNGVAYVVVGPRNDAKFWGRDAQGRDVKPVKIAHLLEFGTAPHAIRKSNGGIQMHPGTQAKPFMGPAYEETHVKQVAIYGKKMMEGIEKRFSK